VVQLFLCLFFENVIERYRFLLDEKFQAKRMQGNNICPPLTPRSRLERLLRERELRKSSRYTQSTEDGRDGNKEVEQVYSDSFFVSENDNEEEVAETVFADDRPRKQRLLVVANRLPVSAVREGVDSYHLEISVGGLVSALLGKKNVCHIALIGFILFYNLF
jgi:trehalose 6-phosphate synthase/phosphatase